MTASTHVRLLRWLREPSCSATSTLTHVLQFAPTLRVWMIGLCRWNIQVAAVDFIEADVIGTIYNAMVTVQHVVCKPVKPTC